jgi:hypothetical protein
MLQQLSGINALIYYSTAVFGAAGLTSPVLGTVLLAVVNLLGANKRPQRKVDAAWLSSRDEGLTCVMLSRNMPVSDSDLWCFACRVDHGIQVNEPLHFSTLTPTTLATVLPLLPDILLATGSPTGLGGGL